MDRSRLEAFSDGVFAVAITLLALNLTVAGPGRGHLDLLDQLHARWPAFLAYLVSFLTIGIIWVNHHALVRSVKTVNRTLLFLNLVLLLFVVLIPFGTATVADYLTVGDPGSRKLAMVLYSAVFLGMSVGFGAMFEWTLRGGHVYHPVPPQQRWRARIRFGSGGAAYLVAAIVAVFSPIAAFVIIGLEAVYYIFERTPASPDSGDDAEPAASDDQDPRDN
jgi:uncharacterized membrane protein